jgi:hypothetical protein
MEDFVGSLTGLAAVMLIFGLPCLWIWTSHQRKLLQMRDQGSSTEMAQMRSKMERMEQRLMVLEKLATDPAARLADDIERLRDKRV